jgi:hypothetical protein
MNLVEKVLLPLYEVRKQRGKCLNCGEPGVFLFFCSISCEITFDWLERRGMTHELATK